MSNKIKILFVMTSCERVGPVQQTLNIIKNLDQDRFDPILITIYDEKTDSMMADYLPYVSSHYLIKTGKMDILLGRCSALKDYLGRINPDIVHTVGVFPNYAVSKIGTYQQIHTIRNYAYDDFPSKYGILKGTLLTRIYLSAIKKTQKVICCSQSLVGMYRKKLGMKFDFIRNSVDVEQYARETDKGKAMLRQKLGLPEKRFIFVYAGSLLKNVQFILENYAKEFRESDSTYLLLLGNGPNLERLEKKYLGFSQIDFRGNVNNVEEYLRASNAYVSASKSEGMPNSVLEAMASGLPFVLSDIEQHKEILGAGEGAGYLYHQGDGDDLVSKMRTLIAGDHKHMGENTSSGA